MEPPGIWRAWWLGACWVRLCVGPPRRLAALDRWVEGRQATGPSVWSVHNAAWAGLGLCGSLRWSW